MKTKFKKFNKVPLLIALIFFVLALCSFIFLFKKINDNNKTSEQAAVASQIETSKRAEIKYLDRILKETQQEQAILETHFVKSSDVVPLLDSIEKIAPQVNTRAEVTQVDVSSDKTSLFVGVNAEGSFENLYKFLTLLENSNYQLEIVSMDMQKISNETSLAPSLEIPGGENSTSTEAVPVKTIKTAKWGMSLRVKLLSYIN